MAGESSAAWWSPHWVRAAAALKEAHTRRYPATKIAVGTDSAGYYLAKARARRYRGDALISKAYFDSAATILEAGTRARPS